MPKMKTSKTAKKRFKKTGTGKLRREQAMRQHLFEKKSSTRTRRLEGDRDVHPTDVKKIKRLLGRALRQPSTGFDPTEVLEEESTWHV